MRLRSLSAGHRAALALGLLVVAVALINTVWIAQDTRPQPGPDPNTYLIETYEFVDSLKETGSVRLWQSISDMSIQGRPPLYQLTSVPFILVFGRSDDAALAVNTLALVILLLATYGIGTLAWNRKAGLLAAFLVAAFPPIVHLSKIFRSHSALPACVALSAWLLLLLLKSRSIKVAWLFGASLAVGMWIHLDFAYLMPAPAVIFGLYMVLFQAEPRWPSGLRATPRWLLTKLRDPLLLYGLLPAAVAAAGLVAVWYLPHWRALFALSEAVEMYWTGEAFGFPSVPLGFWWYALTSPGVISTVLAVLLAVGLVVCLLQRRLSTTFLVVTFLTIYAAFGLRLGDRAWFHFAPVLPIAAAIVAFTVVDCSHWLNALVRNIPFLTRHLSSGRHRDSHVPVSAAVADASQGSAIAAQALRPRSSPTSQVVSLLSASLLTLCVGVAAFNFSLVTWGGGSTNAWSRSIAIALGAPLESGSTCGLQMNLAFCPNPARAEDWASDDILRVVLGDPECQARQCHLVLVPKIMDSFNSVVFDSTLVRDFPQLRTRVRVSNVDGYGGAPGDAGWVVSDYLVYIPEWAGARGREYRIGTAVTSFLKSQPPVFSEMHQEIDSFPLPGGRSAKLLKRNQALTTEKAIQSYEEALLGVPIDIMLLQELGNLYLRVQNWSRAEQLFRQAAELSPALGWPHQGLGYLYQRQGLVERATAEYRQAIEKEPYEQKGYRYLADSLKVAGDLEQVVEVYELAARNNPYAAWPLLELGGVYVATGQLAEAEAAFRKAAEIEPRNPVARAGLETPFYSLASSLGSASAESGGTALVWWQGEAWVRPYPHDPDVLIGHSILPVAGQSRPDQIHFHPAGATQATVLRFDVPSSHYDALHVGYGLADPAAELTNGVRYILRARAESEDSYVTLWDVIASGTGWRSVTVPLLRYWGQDMTLQLSVDALGDDRYDWLQTTLRLTPAREVWDLAQNLAAVQVSASPGDSGADQLLSWDASNAWVDEDGRPLAATSQAPVQGTAEGNQVQLHPFGPLQDTILTFAIAGNPYATLRTAFALADEGVQSGSDGVRYAIAVSTDGGQLFNPLLERDVSDNRWETAVLDLSRYRERDLLIRLVSSSRGDDTYDWLQVTLDLFGPQSVVREVAE